MAYNVAIVGFGYIGTCIGAVLAERGCQVVAFDVRERVVQEINQGRTSLREPQLSKLLEKVHQAGSIRGSSDFSELSAADVVIVTVGTPLGANFDPDTRDIIKATESIAPYLRADHLVILKSTLPPHTTENVVRPILEKAAGGKPFYLAFCPERLAEGRAIEEFKTIPVVVGGVDRESTQKAEQFWRETLNIVTIPVSNATAAELVKLADNLWIDLNVALANELAQLSDRLGANALEVIQAANSLPKGQGHVNILAPSVGVGGYCLTKDPWFVHHMGQSVGLELKTPVASRTVNDGMPVYSFDLIRQLLEKSGRALSSSRIAIMGISFKNNTGDCRFTPTASIVKHFEQSGCALEIHDPWVNTEEARTVTQKTLNPDAIQTLKNADGVIFLTGHDEFKNIPLSHYRELLKPGAVIFDGRNMFTSAQINQLHADGFTYKGVGR